MAYQNNSYCRSRLGVKLRFLKFEKQYDNNIINHNIKFIISIFNNNQNKHFKKIELNFKYITPNSKKCSIHYSLSCANKNKNKINFIYIVYKIS